MRSKRKSHAARNNAGKRVARTAPALATAALAGAGAVFGSDDASACPCLRTGGAVVEAWAFGTLVKASRPDSTLACDLAHVCEVVVESAGG